LVKCEPVAGDARQLFVGAIDSGHGVLAAHHQVLDEMGPDEPASA
jgi:hypothetical protein